MSARRTVSSVRLRCRFYTTSKSTPPPMLLKIRKDLKTAMQRKDTSRLSVLRSLLAETMNASKTSNPINSDLQMLALVRKMKKATQAASEEFRDAGRVDLAEKEENQAKILDEYASGVVTVGEDEIKSTVARVFESMRLEGSRISMGDVLKRVLSPEELGNKPVEKAQVAAIVKHALAVS